MVEGAEPLLARMSGRREGGGWLESRAALV